MMKIDENRLIEELYYQRSAFKFGIKDIIKKDYGGYTVLNDILGNISGKMFPYDGMFYNPGETKQMMLKHQDQQLNRFINITNEYEDYILASLESMTNILDDAEHNFIGYITKVRKYSEKDFLDIIYSYYSTYGNKIYNIVKKYFEENRIHLGYNIDEENVGGFFTKLIYLNSGYIVCLYDTYDSRNMSYLVHELGHAIDAELFKFPQQKKIPSISDIYSEVPSTTFEIGLFDYLRTNKIDDRGPLLLYNNRFQSMRDYSEELHEVSEAEDAVVVDDGDAVVTKDVKYDLSELEQDEDGNVIIGDITISKDKLQYDEEGKVIAKQYIMYPFRDDILYGIGYYMALHLNLIREQDMNEFLKVFNNIITSRNEASFEDMVSKTGFSLDDYLSGKLIKDKVEDKVLTLKRRYKVY